MEQLVADRLHQVGLAEAGAAVDEQRVVADAGFLGDRLAGGVGELAVSADDEAGEGVCRIEAGALGAFVERLAFEGGCLARPRQRRAAVRMRGPGGFHRLADQHAHFADLVENAADRHGQLWQIVGLDPHLMDFTRDRDRGDPVLDAHPAGGTKPPLESIPTDHHTQRFTDFLPPPSVGGKQFHPTRHLLQCCCLEFHV